MKRFIFILSIILFLTNCSKNTGSERTNGADPDIVPPTQSPPNLPEPPLDQFPILTNYLIKTDKDSIFFGVNNFNIEKTKQIIVSNNGNIDLNNLLITGSGDSQISFNSFDCINKVITINSSCSIYLKFLDNSNTANSYKKDITISFGTVSTTVTSYGYSFNFLNIDSLIESIISKQIYENDLTNNIYLGSWRNDENVSSFINNIFITDILYKSRFYYRGDLNINGFNSLYSENLNILDQNSSNFKVLDKSLIFLFLNDKNTESRLDDMFISLNKNDSLNDSDYILQKWINSNSGISKPKELSIPAIEVINNLYKLIYGNDFLNYNDISSDYLVSRKLISNNSEIISDISAQLSYILDYNRISSSSYLENGLKEIDLYFNYFNSKNDLDNLYKISKYYIDHWEYNFNELNEQLLKYNPVEFDYSNFIVTGSSLTNLNNDKLSWITDYSSNWFSNSYSCRDISYALLNLVNSYNFGQLNFNEKLRVENLIKDGLTELKNDLACFYDENNKTFLSQENYYGGYNSNNGIPIILKIYHNLPESIVNVDEKIAIYNQFLNELNQGSLNIENDNSNPLYTSEIIRILMELKDL